MSQQNFVAQTTLAERLTQKRTDAGLSMRQLSREASVDVGYISRLESGANVNLSFDIASRIASVLHVAVDWLLTGREGVFRQRTIKQTIGPDGQVLDKTVEESGNPDLPLPSEWPGHSPDPATVPSPPGQGPDTATSPSAPPVALSAPCRHCATLAAEVRELRTIVAHQAAALAAALAGQPEPAEEEEK